MTCVKKTIARRRGFVVYEVMDNARKARGGLKWIKSRVVTELRIVNREMSKSDISSLRLELRNDFTLTLNYACPGIYEKGMNNRYHVTKNRRRRRRRRRRRKGSSI